MANTDIGALIKQMAQQDPWQLRVIGRQAGLPMFKDLIAKETNPKAKELLQQAYKNELAVIRAAKAQDQAAWDELDAKGKTIFATIKELEKA
jgi:hypothetical protein